MTKYGSIYGKLEANEWTFASYFFFFSLIGLKGRRRKKKNGTSEICFILDFFLIGLKGRRRRTENFETVNWCFEPSQPLRIISGLERLS